MHEHLRHLNPEQREAALHTDGPLLILAGAGSGKTTVLVSRAQNLISSGRARPERLCVMTFTNKAATELKHRVAKRLGSAANKVWAGTFHGFGLQFLKEHWKEAGLPQRFGVIDGNDALAVLKDLLRDHHAYEKERFDVEKVMAKISRLREGLTTGDDTLEGAMATVLFPKFVRRMRHLGVVDFEDLLLRPLKMMNESTRLRDKMQNRYDYVMVDEFQDTNHTQMKLIDQLTALKRNIAVVGDDDQSIYGWRGAEIRNILDFPKRYANCHVVRLERNYRSSAAIIAMANAIIATNEQRHAKVLRPGLDDLGQPPELFIYENEDAEVEQVIAELNRGKQQGYRWRDMAVLYRSNSQGGLIEGGLRHSGIPYKLTGGTALFDRKEVKDALAFIRSAVAPTEISFRRIVNVPARGIGEKTIEAIEEVSAPVMFHQKARLWAADHAEDRAAASIKQLFMFLEDLKTQLVHAPESAEETLTACLREIGYRELVGQSYRDPQIAERRWTSVAILGRILDGMFTRHGRTVDTLDMFIDCMELRDPVTDEDDKKDEVQMMTLHACKGLEFPVVFLLGLEEDLLPHARLGQNIDEERRLFYVGVTRAKKHLIITRVRQRKRHGRVQPVAPSRFLLEIKAELYQEYANGRPLMTGQRESMMAELMARLNKKIAEREAE